MQLIGLTGGFGTGKSTFADRIKSRYHEIAIIDTDEIAHNVLSADFVKLHFCTAVTVDGKVDRSILADMVFSDQEKRLLLNKEMHLKIALSVLKRLIYYYLVGYRRVVVDAPLLFETGLDRYMSWTVVVACRPSLQMERVMRRNQLSLEQARKRIDSQMPLELKCRKATFVLRNDGAVQELNRRVDALIDSTQPAFTHTVYWLPVPSVCLLFICFLAIQLSK